MWSQRFTKQGEKAEKRQGENTISSRHHERVREEVNNAMEDIIALAQTTHSYTSHTESEQEYRSKKGYEASNGLTIDQLFDRLSKVQSEQEFGSFIKRYTTKFLASVGVLSSNRNTQPSEEELQLLLAIRTLARMNARKMPLSALQSKQEDSKDDIKEVILHTILQNSMRLRSLLSAQKMQGITATPSTNPMQMRIIGPVISSPNQGRSV